MTKKSAYPATFDRFECQHALAPNSLNQAKIQPMKRATVAGIVVKHNKPPGVQQAAMDRAPLEPPADDESVWDG